MIRINHLGLLGAAALLAVTTTACDTSVGGNPEAATNPAGQLSATGAPKLRFRPVLATAPSTTSADRQLTDPTKATTPEQQELITAEKKHRQDTALLTMDEQTHAQVLQSYQCPSTDPLAGNDAPELPLITCDQGTATKYVLGPAFLDNTRIVESTAERDSVGTGNIITVRFDAEGTKVWADFTTANVNKQVALAFNTTVLSAPTIADPITGGAVQISGNFTQPDAQHLANQIAGR